MKIDIKVYQEISELITLRKSDDKPLVVGINGVDGSGKTQFAKNLLSFLDQAVCIHIDDFHNPKHHRYSRGEQSPEGYYYDSINYGDFVDEALRPIKHAKKYPVRVKSKLLDLLTDQEDNQFVDIFSSSIVLVEGVFLFRPEIAQFLDLKIFIECNFDITLERMKRRDVEDQNDHQSSASLLRLGSFSHVAFGKPL
jgi:uridine kinase